jgi:hypothetical protein
MYESVKPKDFGDLLFIYLVLLAIRGLFIFGSRPLLGLINTDRQPVSWQNATVMTWGGLRGAVGLALAIQVSQNRAPDSNGVPQISTEESNKVLFFVSGVAFLTTIVNATTAPFLVKKLGILAQPHAQLRLQKMLWAQMVDWSVSESHNHVDAVSNGLRHMVQAIDDSLNSMQVAKEPVKPHRQNQNDAAEPQCASVVPVTGEPNVEVRTSFHRTGGKKDEIKDDPDIAELNTELVKRLWIAERMYKEIPHEDKHLFTLPEDSLLENVDDMKAMVDQLGVDVSLAKAVNSTFLSLVGTSYRTQMADGVLPPGSEEAKSLMTSVRVSNTPLRPDLCDFDFVLKFMNKSQSGDFKVWWQQNKDGCGEKNGNSPITPKEIEPEPSRLAKIVASPTFNLSMAALILANCVYVLIEEGARNEKNKDNAGWAFCEILFTFIFIVEFAVKFKAIGWAYFKDAGNIFDFVLVVLGFAGVVVMFVTEEGDLGASEARMLRIVRIFRVLRFLRVFRFFRTELDWVDPECVAYMKTIRVLESFIQAHLSSQALLVKFFGGKSKMEDDKAEIARCVLQSQAQIYKAISLTIAAKKQMDTTSLQEIERVHQMLHVTEGLEKYVMEAYDCGAISSKEAESILEPLHHKISHIMQEMKSLRKKGNSDGKGPAAAPGPAAPAW